MEPRIQTSTRRGGLCFEHKDEKSEQLKSGLPTSSFCQFRVAHSRSLHRAGTANLPGAGSHISGLDTREGLLHTILLRYSSWSFTRQHSNTDQDQTSFTTRVSRASCGPQHLANPTDPLAWSGRPEIGPWQTATDQLAESKTICKILRARSEPAPTAVLTPVWPTSPGQSALDLHHLDLQTMMDPYSYPAGMYTDCRKAIPAVNAECWSKTGGCWRCWADMLTLSSAAAESFYCTLKTASTFIGACNMKCVYLHELPPLLDLYVPLSLKRDLPRRSLPAASRHDHILFPLADESQITGRTALILRLKPLD
ncbi:hypothetical protein RRG08_036583 [Elysia crispata]|uniref:Uncharacterized protein n=1 Tax=Elysia crispata TaxID=231223 RepID=A0AAE1DLK6_9GAST|nr:hypothetical protein RRG08_036583 [Elysia crispata]